MEAHRLWRGPAVSGGSPNMMYSVYVIKSEKNGKHYIGYTSNLDRRLKDHNLGKNISTKNNIPWVVIYNEKFEDKKSAWLRERQIKSYKHGEAFKKLIKQGGVA